MIIPLPGGTQIDIGNSQDTISFNAVTLHTPKALGRLIEYWKNKSTLRLWQSAYTDEIQLLENAIWDLYTAYLLDYAGTAQLDTIGKIVGERRNGLSNAAYRIRIRVRILINNSFGRAPQIKTIIKRITGARFVQSKFGTASFRISFLEPLESVDLELQIPQIVEEASALGVGFMISYPASANGARYGFSGDPTLNAHGYGFSGDATVGGDYSHAV